MDNAAGRSFGGIGAEKGKASKDDVDEKGRTAAERFEEKVRGRIESPQTNTGLRDWLFNCAAIVADLKEIVEPEVSGFRYLMDAIREGAESLTDANWIRFTELPFSRTHLQDQDVHTSLFTRTEPSWKQTMTMPKTGKTCVFLHIGTRPPSEALLKLFSRLGWYGVDVSPGTQKGFEDCVQSFDLDPGSHKDDEEFELLLRKRQGQVPKPDYFPLVYVNLVFSMFHVEEDSEEDEPLPEEIRDRWAEISATMPPSPQAGGEPDLYQDLHKNQNGYGKLGVTRAVHVRRRLRAIRNSLAVGLQRLADKGTLVICWPGLPYHPVLLFVVSYLRTLFQRTHTIVQENNTVTWELYILCSNFNRESSQQATLGTSGSLFKSFMDSSFRRNCVDDVLLWTLTDKQLFSEARVGAGGKSQQKGWEDLWTQYGKKFKNLAVELAQEQPLQPPPEKTERKEQEKKAERAPPKPKPKTPSETKPAKKPAPKEKAADRTSSKATKAEERPPKKEARLPPVASAAADGVSQAGESTLPGGSSQDEPPADFEIEKPGTAESASGKLMRQRRRLQLTRSLPSLSGTFGCAPGVDLAKGADATMLARKWPLVKYGLRCAEEASLFGH